MTKVDRTGSSSVSESLPEETVNSEKLAYSVQSWCKNLFLFQTLNKVQEPSPNTVDFPKDISSTGFRLPTRTHGLYIISLYRIISSRVCFICMHYYIEHRVC